MRTSRMFTITLIVATLATVGSLFAQEETPTILILPGAGSIGTAHTITLFDFAANMEVDLTITRVADDETYFQIQLVTDEEGRASTVVHSGPEDAPGEYRVSANPEGRSTLSTTFQILSEGEEAERVQPVPTYGGPLPIEDGAEITGETTAEKGIDAYTFAASAGDVLNVKLQSQSFDAYLVLLNEAGEELTMDDDSGDELNAQIEKYPLPESGQFTLLATSWRYYQLGEDVSVGEYRLQFQLQRGDTTNEEPSPTNEDHAAPAATAEEEQTTNNAAWETNIAAELSETKPSRRYQFNIRQGQTLSLRLRSNDFDAYIVIENADGEILAEDDDGDGGLNAKLEELVFPADGEYFAIVSSWDHWNVENTVKSGAFTLEVWGDPIDWLGEVAEAGTQSEEESSSRGEEEKPADTHEREQEETTTDAGTEETGVDEIAEEQAAETHYRPIGYGDRLAAPLPADSEGLYFSLDAESGDRVDIVVASYSQLDTHIEVHTPAGELLAADDDSGRGYNPELLGLTLPETGTYTIIIRPLSQGDDQPVSIAIDQRAPAILAEAPLNIKLSAKQVSEAVVLEVSEAGEIRLHLAIDGMQTSPLRIVATQGGETLASLEIQGLRELEWLLDAREAGELQLLFSQHGTDALQLQLERSHAPKTEAAADE